MKTVQLVSGGLDSELVAFRHPGAQRVFVDYGQPEAMHEMAAARGLWPDCSVLSVSGASAKKDGKVYYPARNLWLASCAVMFFGADRVLMGGMADDNCIDKTPEAFAAMSDILSKQANRKVQVDSPFWDTDKSTAVAQYLNDGGKVDRLLATFSCYVPGEGHCLNCEACFRWAVALLSNGVDVPPPNEAMVKLYMSKLHTYSVPRRWAILRALRQMGEGVVAIDVDGVLCEEAAGHDYRRRKPMTKCIEALNALAESHWVVLYTARREIDRATTVEWMEKHIVHYDALVMEKLPYSAVVDDKSTPYLMSSWTP